MRVKTIVGWSWAVLLKVPALVRLLRQGLPLLFTITAGGLTLAIWAVGGWA